jgi:hypothetical protein
MKGSSAFAAEKTQGEKSRDCLRAAADRAAASVSITNRWILGDIADVL